MQLTLRNLQTPTNLTYFATVYIRMLEVRLDRAAHPSNLTNTIHLARHSTTPITASTTITYTRPKPIQMAGAGAAFAETPIQVSSTRSTCMETEQGPNPTRTGYRMLTWDQDYLATDQPCQRALDEQLYPVSSRMTCIQSL